MLLTPRAIAGGTASNGCLRASRTSGALPPATAKGPKTSWPHYASPLLYTIGVECGRILNRKNYLYAALFRLAAFGFTADVRGAGIDALFVNCPAVLLFWHVHGVNSRAALFADIPLGLALQNNAVGHAPNVCIEGHGAPRDRSGHGKNKTEKQDGACHVPSMTQRKNSFQALKSRAQVSNRSRSSPQSSFTFKNRNK